AFSAEALPQEGRADATSTERMVDVRLRRPGAQWLWEVEGEPVCTAILSAPVAGVVRISGVYTPPEKRGRGYGSACVAGVSQHALDTGASACMLYTDRANPVSNKIYQAIGYRPVGDTQEWRFGPTPLAAQHTVR
ncbi:MAG: GNAT family N-acetyltransferase, partial [Micromonosporaceae bacterium]